MTSIILLTTVANVQEIVMQTQAYLRHQIQIVETIEKIEQYYPDLILWHPVEPNDRDARRLVACCPHIIFIYSPHPIPPEQRRLGGSYQYASPWNRPLPSLPEQTFRALMPLDPEGLAFIIAGKLGLGIM